MSKSFYYFIVVSLLFFTKGLSQEIDNSIKNEMVKFLYEKKELSDKDLNYLLQNSQNKNVVLVWFEEKKIETTDTGLKVFLFGTSTEHSKEYVMLSRGNNEKLFFGVDMNDELKQNSFFNFIRFYGLDKIMFFYKKIFSEIILKVYDHNLSIYNLKNFKFIEVYKK